MPVSDAVGLRVLEAMRGDVKRPGGSASEPISFSTFQVVECLNDFVDGTVSRRGTTGHFCDVEGGHVKWQDGAFPRQFVITGGTIEMFRDTTASGREKQFEFNIEFQGPGGAPYLLFGRKELRADGPVQAIDALGDLSTLRGVEVRDLTLGAPGVVVASGELHVGLPDLADQLQNLSFPGVQSQAELANARADFLGFMNGQLSEVYSIIPGLFHESRSLLWHQQLLVSMLLDVFIPGPKAASAADVIAQLDLYLANTALDLGALLQAFITFAEQLLGQAIAQADPLKLRVEVRKALATAPTDGFTKTRHDLLRQLHLVLVAAYYSCPGAGKQIGYTPAATRPVGKNETLKLLKTIPKPRGPYDVVIAGSGVGGSVLAHRLATEGYTVCLLESGRYHHERSFSSDEIDALSRTYAFGGMQTARDVGRPVQPLHRQRDITVLQARAVGGGGLVNNAVCFRLPKPTFDRWANVGFPVKEKELNRAYDAIAQQLGIIPASEATGDASRLNPMSRYFEAQWGPVRKHDASLPNEPGLYECNVNMGAGACTGCGYCNHGCSFEAKRNSLQVHLKEAVATGNLDIVPLARVHSLSFSGKKVKSAQVIIGAGEQVEVKAKEFVVACGPIQSSALLLRSGLGHKLIGRRVSANIGAPVLAFMQEPMTSFGHLQISHFLWPDEPSPRFVVESWFNAPAAQAMVMPGYLEDHQYRMGSYAHLAIAAPLVGTLASGTVDAAGKLSFPIGNDDLGRVHQGHLFIADTLFNPNNPSPIDHLVMPTEHGVPIYDRAGLQDYANHFDDARALVVGTGHPQGGNGMSTDNAIGPVGADFRVKGTDNLRVCDGSLFPDCAGINPQWTIMALAYLCGESMV